MRGRALVEAYQAGDCHERSMVLAQLKELNRCYRTRYSLDQLDWTSRIICDAICQKGWWQAPPRPLLGCDDSTADLITGVPMQVLSRSTSTGNKRPYSLLTKFLFFCFPETFPIYDSWAAEAIQLWSYLTFKKRDSEWELFRRDRMADSSGSGYRGIIEFYRRLWAERLARSARAAQGLCRSS